MHQDKAIGMFMGLFIGDALGAPLEFIRPEEMKYVLSEMEGGGVHNTKEGEWTDDGAMAMCIADAYITERNFVPEQVAFNFKTWKKTGHFGTRNYLFDIGRTCAEAIDKMTMENPYQGGTAPNKSGNGSIMRLAPIILYNHNNYANALAQSIAISLMTHGNTDTVDYIAAFATELFYGEKKEEFDGLRHYQIKGMSTQGKGSIMHAYNMAWHCVEMTHSFEDAVVMAVNKGHDADTVGAVTGMLAGRKYGYKGVPQRWREKLVDHDKLVDVAEQLYALGARE